MPDARCWCNRTRRWHCQFDEPGVDHATGCKKRHHEFKEAAVLSASYETIDKDNAGA